MNTLKKKTETEDAEKQVGQARWWNTDQEEWTVSHGSLCWHCGLCNFISRLISINFLISERVPAYSWMIVYLVLCEKSKRLDTIWSHSCGIQERQDQCQGNRRRMVIRFLVYSLGRNQVDCSEMAKYSRPLCGWQIKSISHVKTSSRCTFHSELYNLGRLNTGSKK